MPVSSVQNIMAVLARVIENANVGMMFLDMSGQVVLVNEALAQMVGRHRADCLDKSAYDFLHPEEHDDARKRWGELGSGVVDSYTVERRYRRKNGSVFWVEISSATVTDDSGGAIGFYVQVTGIEKQKRAEAALSAAETRWSFALDSAGQGVWDYDLVLGSWYFSSGWKRLRGIPEDEEIDGNEADWLEVVHPDDREMVVEMLRQQHTGETEDVAYAYREKHRDGRWIWILAKGKCVEHDQDGRPVRFIGTDTDITQLKENEIRLHELANRELRWKIAVESANHGLWDHNLLTGERFHSGAWRAMRGYDPDTEIDLEQDAPIGRVHPDDRAGWDEHKRQQKWGGDDTFSHEYRDKHKDGHWVWILSRGKTVERGPDGAPTRNIGIDIDITALKESEEQFRRLANSELRWKVAVESAEQGVWDLDHTTGTRFFSKSWRRMRGMAEDEDSSLSQEEWLLNIHPEDRERVLDYVRRQDAGEVDAISYEFRERHRDGHWMWILSRGKPVAWSADGKVPRLIGIDTDITELKQREEALALLSRRHELALSTSRIGIWETNVATRETQWDARTRAIFGVPPDALTIPKDVWVKALHPDDRERAMAIVEAAHKARDGYSFDYRIVLGSGEVRHVRCRATYHNDAVEGLKVVGVNWDVTPDYLKAEELRRATALAEERNLQLEAARAKMEYNALHDPLTGLPNRRFLDAELVRLATERGRGGNSIVVLNIDLDRFKQINDTLGHAAGDAMLNHMANLLRENVREDDTVARIGGDEFVVVLSPAPSKEMISKLIGRIIARASEPMMFEGQECRSGVSIGIASAQGSGIDARQLLVNSDIALYRAKSEGRNRAAFFTDKMQREIFTTKKCADDILKGLERGEFIPYYQPQFDAHSLDVVGVEALVRWSHPVNGILAPEHFLGVAEDLNAVSAIDRVVLEQSLAHLSGWQRKGLVVPHVSVNVSARRLQDEKLIPSLKKLNIKPGSISFELLESIFLDDHDDLAAWNIDQIKELGIDIAVDDFGSGHASIVSLLRLNPRQLKIDRQIVRPITESEAQRRLVRSIVEIGKSQGIEVCAEGVETLDHVHILRDLGCDVLQGFYFARPMPVAQFTRFLRDEEWRKAS